MGEKRKFSLVIIAITTVLALLHGEAVNVVLKLEDGRGQPTPEQSNLGPQ